MMFIVLMTYLIIMCWWCYSWIRTKMGFFIRSFKELIVITSIVFIFVFIFVFVLRLLNIFRDRKTFDLYNLNIELNMENLLTIFLFIILLYSLRRLLVYFFKVMWFRLHYFLLSPFNLPNLYTFYNKFHYNFIYNPLVKMYKILKLVNIFSILGLMVFFFKDLICNYGVLDQSLLYLRYYSILKILCLLSKFAVEKQILILDYYNYNMYYGGACDEEPFHTIMCKKHRIIRSEAMDYKDGVIMESIDYKPKKIDYTDNDYYRYLSFKVKSVTVKVYSSFDEFVEDIKDKKNL